MPFPDSARRSLMALLALTLALAVSVVAPATASAETLVLTDQFDVVVVVGNGYSVSPDGCEESSVYVDATENREGRSAVYARLSYNWCTSESSAIFGQTLTPTFDYSTNLAQAHLQATIQVVNLLTGEPAGEVMIDNTWSAISGPVDTSHYLEKFESGGARYILRSDGRFRQATVTGTVPLQSADIGLARQWSFILVPGGFD